MLRLCAALLLFTGSINAQLDGVDVRTTIIQVANYSGGTLLSYGVLKGEENSTNGMAILRWNYTDPSGQLPPSTISFTTSLNRISGIIRLDLNNYLVFGRRHLSSQPLDYVGAFERIQILLSPAGITSLETTDIGVIDPIVANYNSAGKRIYLVDDISRSLRVSEPADLLGGSGLPSSYTQLADYLEVPILATPNLCELKIPTDSKAEEQTGVRLSRQSDPRFTLVDLVGSGWVIDESSWVANVKTPHIVTETFYLPINHPWNISVAGGSPVFPLEVQVMGEGGLNSTCQLTSSTGAINPLASGATLGGFGIIDSSSVIPANFRMCIQYGDPQQSSILRLGRVHVDGLGPWADRRNMTVFAQVLPDPINGVVLPTALSGALWIGVRNVDGSDPVTVTNGSAVLSPLQTRPFTLGAGTMPHTLSFTLPLAVNTSDLVLLLQIVVTNGNQLSFTDVFGIKIRDHNPLSPQQGALSMQGGSMSVQSLQSHDEKVKLLVDGFGRPEESKGVLDVQLLRESMLLGGKGK